MNRFAPLLLPCPLPAAAATPTLKEVDRIHIGGEARWDYVTVGSAAHRLYVSHASQTEVIDTRTDQLVGTIADTAGVNGVVTLDLPTKLAVVGRSRHASPLPADRADLQPGVAGARRVGVPGSFYVLVLEKSEKR